MRILYFTQTQTPHDNRFTQALAETHHQVFVLCLEPGADRVWPKGIEEIHWQAFDAKHSSFHVDDQAKRLKEIVNNYRIDLIHAGPIQDVAYLAVVAGFHPLVSMSWGSDLLLKADESKTLHEITRQTLANTDVLVGDCACVGQKAASFGFDLKYYRQFPWGVDLTHFTPKGSHDLRTQLGWKNKIILLSNRSFESLYGVEVLLKVFSIAAHKNRHLRLLLFGSGSQEKMLKQLVHDNGLDEVVYFGGKAGLKDLPDVYRSADFYLSASHSDGSSVSLMEALACGLPVIVSDIPGNREWIQEGEQGWLFRDGDVQNMYEIIVKAGAYGRDFSNMKKNNRQLAEKRADWKKNFPVLLDAYELAMRKVSTDA